MLLMHVRFTDSFILCLQIQTVCLSYHKIALTVKQFYIFEVKFKNYFVLLTV